jgi:predicted RNA binding protein YcfA (HicA-like mRNA interferase family)
VRASAGPDGVWECRRSPTPRAIVVVFLHGTPIVKVREVIRMLEREGWRMVRQRGSHRQLKHPFRKGVVTIAGRESADLPLGTLKSIYRQAGIRR